MCNLANLILDKEPSLRASARSRSRALPRGVVSRLSKSVRQGFVSRRGFALGVIAAVLLVGASPAAWATSAVTFNGVISTSGAPDVASSQPTSATVDVSGESPTAGAQQIAPTEPLGVAFGHVQLAAPSGVIQTLSFTVGVGTTLGMVRALTLGAPNLDFTVAGGTTCTSGTTGAACAVSIQFLPRAPGLRRGAVVLYDNENPPKPLLTVPLSGTADSPLAALGPSTPTLVNMGNLATVSPFQIALDGAGNLYVGNYGNTNVLKVAPGGGSGSAVATGSIPLVSVAGVALDGAGNLFVADRGAGHVVVVTPEGIASVLTISGLGAGVSRAHGLGARCGGKSLYGRWEIRPNHQSFLDRNRRRDLGGRRIGGGHRQLCPRPGCIRRGGGWRRNRLHRRSFESSHRPGHSRGRCILLTLAGITPALSSPQGVGVDAMGNVYIADTGNGRVIQVTTAGVAAVVSTPGLNSTLPFGVTVDPSGNIFISDRDNHRISKFPLRKPHWHFQAPGSV